MRAQDIEQLLPEIEELRQLLAACSTEGIVGACFGYWIRRDSASDHEGLTSAYRQWAFLLGLMLTTAEPSEQRAFGEAEFDRSRALLEKIFRAYGWAYFPEAGEGVTDEWRRSAEVAMPAFLAYFNQGFLASPVQVEQRIRRYLAPFDGELRAEFGISATQAVEVCRWISDRLQATADTLRETTKREKGARLDLLDRAESEHWDMERVRAEANVPAYRDLAISLIQSIREMSFVSLTDLTARFGEGTATAFWSLFSAKRGDVAALTYPTEANPAEERSLYVIEPERAMCSLANQLFLAVLNRFERHLSTSKERKRFFSKRDDLLEQEVEASFRALLGPTAAFFPQVFETSAQQHEHDLVIRLGRVALVVEAKASPPVEPFRDPEKAFVRIRRAFKSDRGIQHAYGQGRRIWRRWAAGGRVELYDDREHLVCAFDKSDVDEVVLIAATRDNFGVLATDLSLLLEKEHGEPYPWCVNAVDLDAIADAWNYFAWDADRFLRFLRDRVKLHGRAMCSDELEMVGSFIAHDGLHWLLEPAADLIWLTPDYSEVFDKICMARMGGAPVKYEPHPPYFGDFRESLRQGKAVALEATAERPQKRQGRNERCACGSGLKYKRCCGK